jgi:ABC-2 type transport system permease protein
MLGGPTLLALRLSRGATAAWLAGMGIAGYLYGSFAHSAGEAFANSPVIKRFAGALAGIARQGAELYAGVVFLIVMTALMLYAASAMAGVRESEADGHLDNLLVRRVGRLYWIAGRLSIITAVTVTAGLVAAVAFWVGSATQHTGLDPGDLVAAGLNAAAPGLLVLGITTATLGIAPRATAVVGYAFVAWSFLLEMLGSVTNINHWLMDTSLLHHIALAPTVGPKWSVVGTYVALAAALTTLGCWRLTVRDIALS